MQITREERVISRYGAGEQTAPKFPDEAQFIGSAPAAASLDLPAPIPDGVRPCG